MYKNPVDKRDVFHPEREERQSIQKEIMDKANERSANIQAIKILILLSRIPEPL